MGVLEETTGESPEVTDTSEGEPSTSTETTGESSETEDPLIRPEAAPRRLFEVTDHVVKDGNEIKKYRVTADEGVSACLQTYVFEEWSSVQNKDIWSYHNRLHVGIGPDETIEDVNLAYEKGYAPPSQPYDPTLNDVVQAVETENGIAFDPQVTGEIQDVDISSDLFKEEEKYQIRDDGNVLIPYDVLNPYYLSRPLYDVEATMTQSETNFLLEVPQPSVSMTVQDVAVTETENDEVQLGQIAAEVTMDSKKPTQYVNLHTNFGGSASYDYGREIEAEDFTSIDGQGTTRVERDFTVGMGSNNIDYFEEFYPIERSNFDVVLGQVAPLATKVLPADQFIP